MFPDFFYLKIEPRRTQLNKKICSKKRATDNCFFSLSSINKKTTTMGAGNSRKNHQSIDHFSDDTFTSVLLNMTNKEIILMCNESKSVCERIKWRFLCLKRFPEKFEGRNVDAVLQEMNATVEHLPNPFVCRISSLAMACKCFYYWTKGQRVVAWGSNRSNQLTNVPTEAGFTDIACGAYYSVALKRDGTLRCWGNNHYNQLRGVPTEAGFIAIACGFAHSVALKRDGTIRCWGSKTSNQLRGTPTDAGFIAIACGNFHSVALKRDGTLRCWGNNFHNQLRGTPTEAGFIAIACGFYHSVALKRDGTLRCWGNNDDDQLRAPTEAGFIAIACGFKHSVALRHDGTIRC